MFELGHPKHQFIFEYFSHFQQFIQIQQTWNLNEFGLAQLVSDMFEQFMKSHDITCIIVPSIIYVAPPSNQRYFGALKKLWCSQVQEPSARNDQGEGETALWILRLRYLGDPGDLPLFEPRDLERPGDTLRKSPKKWAVEMGESSIDPSVIPTEWAEHCFLNWVRN